MYHKGNGYYKMGRKQENTCGSWDRSNRDLNRDVIQLNSSRKKQIKGNEYLVRGTSAKELRSSGRRKKDLP